MVVAGIVERRIHSEICVQVTHMVAYHIHHHQNTTLVTGIHEIDEIFLTAEFVV